MQSPNQTGADEQNAQGCRPSIGVVEASRSRQIALPRRFRLVKGAAHVGITHQVIDLLGLHRTQNLFQCFARANVALVQFHSIGQMCPDLGPYGSTSDADDAMVALREQCLGQMAAGKTRHSGY